MVILRAARSRKLGPATSAKGVGGERKSVENILGVSRRSIVLFRINVLEGGKWTWKLSRFSARARDAITLLLMLVGGAVNGEDIEGIGARGLPVMSPMGVAVAMGEVILSCRVQWATLPVKPCGTIDNRSEGRYLNKRCGGMSKGFNLVVRAGLGRL